LKTLHLYLLRQVLATLVLTVATFTFVLLLGNVLKEILALLVNRQADMVTVIKAIGLLIPFVLAFALPVGMLTAALLIFGRFSADNELTAVRASGVSLVALVTPILLLSVLLSGVCASVNLYLAPRCRVAYKHLLYELGVAHFHSLLPERTVIRDFPGCIVYFGKVNGDELKDVLIYELDRTNGAVQASVHAARGRLTLDQAQKTAKFQLFEMHRTWIENDELRTGYTEESEMIQPLSERSKDEPSVSELTFWELRVRQKELEQQLASSPGKVSNAELRQHQRRLEGQIDVTQPFKVQMHRQVAFSFACIGFTLVGIPLGIRAHRRETSAGVALALVLLALYYSFVIVGQSLETRPEYAPHLIVWIPNFIFQVVGGVLLWRANRGG